MPKPLTVWIITNCGKFLEMGIPDYLTCLLRTVRIGHGTTDWFQIRKGVRQDCILSPCLFNLHAEYIMWNARLDEAQAGIKTAGRNVIHLGYADDTTLLAESEELKGLLMKVKEESEKVGLKLNIQKTKIMASSPITSWQIDGKTVETVSDFIFRSSKITADGNCSHEIKRCFLLGRKATTSLDGILKSRDITLPTKVHLVKAMVFFSGHVWMWELDYKDSWALENWSFWTVVLEKTLKSSLDFKEIKPVNPEGNQSQIFIGRTDAEAETLTLWPPDVKNWLIGKDPDAGKDWRWEEKGTTEDVMIGWHHWLNGSEFE